MNNKKAATTKSAHRDAVSKILTSKPKPAHIRLIKVSDKTTIGQLAEAAGLKKGTLITALFRSGSTATITQKVDSLTDAIKLLNKVGQDLGFKITRGPSAVRVGDKTTFAELAAQAGINVSKIIDSMKDAGYEVLAEDRVRSLKLPIAKIRNVIVNHGGQVLFKKLDTQTLMNNSNYNNISVERRFPRKNPRPGNGHLADTAADLGYTTHKRIPAGLKATDLTLKDNTVGLVYLGSLLLNDEKEWAAKLRGVGVSAGEIKKDLKLKDLGVLRVAAFTNMLVDLGVTEFKVGDVKFISRGKSLLKADGSAKTKAPAKKATKKTGTSKVVKKTSSNASGLTVRELENEIFKIDGLRVVIRASDSLRTGAAKYGKRLPKGALMEDLTARLDRYFRKSKHAEELVGVQFAVVDAKGKAHYNTLSPKKVLSEAAFV
jgi:hypothetical protein